MTDERVPPWCQDPTCTPDALTMDKREGGSGFCCGRTEEVMVTERRGIRHENDGHFCIKSPRGVAMFEVCAEDLEVIARNALRGLLARGPDRKLNPRWFIARDEWPISETDR